MKKSKKYNEKVAHMYDERWKEEDRLARKSAREYDEMMLEKMEKKEWKAVQMGKKLSKRFKDTLYKLEEKITPGIHSWRLYKVKK